MKAFLQKQSNKDKDESQLPLVDSSSSFRHGSGRFLGRNEPLYENPMPFLNANDSFKNRGKMRKYVRPMKTEEENDQPERKKKVSAYCTAESYDIDSVFLNLEKQANLQVALHRDVIHLNENDRFEFFKQ